MKEKKLQIFVDIVRHYFDQFGEEELVVDTPYLLENTQNPNVKEYTGLIGISGVHKGVVYVTASQELLESILLRMGEEVSNELMIDLVGEIANTISGNARTEFGHEFHISVPFVFKGAPQSVILPREERSFIIPVTWQGHAGEIVICLKDS